MRRSPSLRAVTVLAFGLSSAVWLAPASAEPGAEPAAKAEAPKVTAPAASPATAPQTDAQSSPAPANGAAPSTAAAPAAETAAGSAPDNKGADYYERRAAQTLEADAKAAMSVPHPLAAPYPDYSVVVCTAGCPHAKTEEIVAMKPKAAPTVATMGMMETTAGTAGGNGKAADAGLPTIDCLAGCYDTPKMYLGRAKPEKDVSVATKPVANLSTAEPVVVKADGWQTTVAAAPANPAPASVQDAKKSAGAAAKSEDQKTQGKSGEWMAKINLERAGDKAPARTAEAKPSAPAAPAPASLAADKSAAVAASTAVTSPVAPAAAARIADVKPPAATMPSSPAKTEPANAPAPAAEAVSTPPAAAPANSAAAKPAAAAVTPVAAMPAPALIAAPAHTSEATPPASAAAASPAKAAHPDTAAPAPVAATTPAAPAAPAMPASTKPAARMEASAAAAASAPSPAVTTIARVAEVIPTAAAVATPAPQRPADTFLFASKDAAMNAAVTKARRTLPEFWTAMEKPAPGVTDFALKVAIEDKGQVEHFWLTGIVRQGDKLTGTISNDPEIVKNVKAGQRYDFAADRVSDWLFKRKGKMVGNETMRPMLTHMPKKEAETYRAMYETP